MLERQSPVFDAYKLAQDYKAEHGEPDTGVYPTSRYQQLRYALWDSNQTKARAEIDKLIAQEKADHPNLDRHAAVEKVREGFEASVFHAWTKNAEMDKEFFASLDPKDKMKLMQAQQQRDRTWLAFTRALGVSSERRHKH